MLGNSGSFLGLNGEIVTVLVGKAETPFNFHRDLLTSKSSFFNAALSGSWKEATEGKIRLVEEDERVFSAYVLWVYNQDWIARRDGGVLSFDYCCRLYVLADQYGSEELQNQVIDKLREKAARSKSTMKVDTIAWVYNTTLPESALRRLLADLLAWEMDVGDYEELVEAAPQCLYDALKIRPPRSSKAVAPYHETVACKNYHTHRDGTSCSLPPTAPDASQDKQTRRRTDKSRARQ
ncbi:MAG: hypothetical protein Q9213_005911 [Squamulea squamosa]